VKLTLTAEPTAAAAEPTPTALTPAGGSPSARVRVESCVLRVELETPGCRIDYTDHIWLSLVVVVNQRTK
jgi:hypothetical protein